MEQLVRPTGLVEGNRFDTSVAVEIIASRFFYHLPYYRQQDMFAGYGWTPSRSTLLNIVTASEFVLQPLAAYYRSLLGQIDVLETMTPVQFNSFRSRLDSASGFQSAQFRELEFVSGLILNYWNRQLSRDQREEYWVASLRLGLHADRRESAGWFGGEPVVPQQ